MSEILYGNEENDKDLDGDGQEISRLVEKTSSELFENLTNTERQFFEYVNKIIWLDTNALKNEITKIKDILYIDDAVFVKALSKVFKILFHKGDYHLAQKIAYIGADIFLIDNNISETWIRNIISCRIELEEILISDLTDSISSLRNVTRIRGFEDTSRLISILIKMYGKIANVYGLDKFLSLTKSFFNNDTNTNDNYKQLIDIAKNTTKSVNDILGDIMLLISNIINDNSGNKASYIINTSTGNVEINDGNNGFDHEGVWILSSENLIKGLKQLIDELNNIIKDNEQLHS